MKLLVAIHQPPRYQAIVSALSKLSVLRMTVFDAVGVGRQRGRMPTFRGNEYDIQFLRKSYLALAISNRDFEATVQSITNAARTGQNGCIGDGKIFALPMENAIDIASGRQGSEAL